MCEAVRTQETTDRLGHTYTWLVYECGQAKLVDRSASNPGQPSRIGARSYFEPRRLGHRCLGGVPERVAASAGDGRVLAELERELECPGERVDLVVVGTRGEPEQLG